MDLVTFTEEINNEKLLCRVDIVQLFPGQCYENGCYKCNDYEVVMVPGMTLQSRSGHYTVHFQSDSNLVLYCERKPLWHTNTANDMNIDKLLL